MWWSSPLICSLITILYLFTGNSSQELSFNFNTLTNLFIKTIFYAFCMCIPFLTYYLINKDFQEKGIETEN